LFSKLHRISTGQRSYSAGLVSSVDVEKVPVKILFLDQSGKPGGAELCLIDIAKPYRDRCLVGLFADGSFPE